MKYCPKCGGDAAPDSRYCEDCGDRLSDPASPEDTTPTHTPNAETPSEYWYYGVMLPLIALAGAFLYGATLGAFGVEGFPYQNYLNGIYWLSSLAAAFSFYFEKQYIKSVTGWEPSNAYYAVILPTANIIICLVYWWQRRKQF